MHNNNYCKLIAALVAGEITLNMVSTIATVINRTPSGTILIRSI